MFRYLFLRKHFRRSHTILNPLGIHRLGHTTHNQIPKEVQMVIDRQSQEYLARMTAYSCIHDARFNYYVYVPENWMTSKRKERYRLIVLVHGSERAPEHYRNKFKKFAEKNNAVILAPLFPAGLPTPEHLENYNMLRCGDIAFDIVLLGMIDELNERFPVETHSIFLHGFSAGGQFAHRFFSLYPERIHSVSIGAPGDISLLDDTKPWPEGSGGMRELFGRAPDCAKLPGKRVQIIVGDADNPAGNGSAGPDRVEINRGLCENYRSVGIDVEFTMVPGVSHEGFKLLPEVMSFFESGMKSP